jgi:glycerol kinase
MEILDTVRKAMEGALAVGKKQGIDILGNLKAIGITNQRETTVIWSKSTGKAYYNAVVWMDSRTSSICRRLEKDHPEGGRRFTGTCGLPIHPYFSATKILWLMENVPEVKQGIESGDALFGTIDTWLIWNLTGGVKAESPVHVTDCTNAARTMLMELNTLKWHEPTLEALGIPSSILPRIISNAELIGKISEDWPLAGVQLAGCLGDQHAATLGQQCKAGEAKSTYGTGCFIVLNTGEQIVPSNHGLLTTVSYKLGPDAPTQYALEGSIAIGGAAVQWLRDNLGIIQSSSEIEPLARSVENTGGVYFVPAFSGLFAPWWRDDARGVLVGITRYTNKAHIARATLESMCYQVKEVLTAMKADAGNIEVMVGGEFILRVDGGATVNSLLMQLQADLLGSPVVRPIDIETTALGAAYAAGLAVGVWTKEQIIEQGAVQATPTTFLSQITDEDRDKRCRSWNKAVERSFGLSDLDF